MRKTQVNIEEMHRISCSCVSLTRRAHKPRGKTGAPRHMHPRDKTKTHLSASYRKEDLGDCHLGVADT